MKIKSFTKAEEQRIYEYLAEHCIEDSRAVAAILVMTAGLKLKEVCAIRFGDLQLISSPTTVSKLNKGITIQAGLEYSLRISRVYAYIAGEYKVTDLVGERTVYRVIPLSEQCIQHIINRYHYLQQNFGPLDDDINKLPIICEYKDGNGYIKKHYRPDYLSKYIRKLLVELGIEQSSLYMPPVTKGGSYTNFSLNISANLLRQHFHHRLKHTCGMTDGEMLYLLGRKCQDVDSRHYRDFLEKYNQLVLKQKLDRWKIREIPNVSSEDVITAGDSISNISTENKWSATVLPATNQNYSTVVLDLETATPGYPVNIDLRCLKGCTGTIVINSTCGGEENRR